MAQLVFEKKPRRFFNAQLASQRVQQDFYDRTSQNRFRVSSGEPGEVVCLSLLYTGAILFLPRNFIILCWLLGTFKCSLFTPSTPDMSLAIVIGVSIVIVLASYATFWVKNSPRRKRERLRRQVEFFLVTLFPSLWTSILFSTFLQLPENLDHWRTPGSCHEAEEKIWQDLTNVFHRAGYTLWPHTCGSILKTPGNTYPISSGFGYAIPSRPTPDQGTLGTAVQLCRFVYSVRGISARLFHNT